MSSSKTNPKKRLDHLARVGSRVNRGQPVDPTAAEGSEQETTGYEFFEGEDEQAKAEPIAFSSPIHTLAKATLASALTVAQRRRIAGSPRLSVLVEAPTPAWIQPLRRAIAAMGPWAKLDARDVVSRPRLRAEEGEAELVELLAAGRRVAVVSWLPERYVPRSFVDAADIRVSPGHPSPTVLRRVIREATGTRPRRMPASIQGADYPDYLAAIRAGDGAARRRTEAGGDCPCADASRRRPRRRAPRGRHGGSWGRGRLGTPGGRHHRGLATRRGAMAGRQPERLPGEQAGPGQDDASAESWQVMQLACHYHFRRKLVCRVRLSRRCASSHAR
jgi:hypothetical protein